MIVRIGKQSLIILVLVFFGPLTSSLAQDTLSVPEFSEFHGFFEESFELIVTSDINGASIIYTLDGSNPITSESSTTLVSPGTIEINPENPTGRFTAPGVVVRAIASMEGYESSKPFTQTYMFLNYVTTLSPDEERPGTGWPERNMENGGIQYMDYGLDPDVYNDPDYENFIDDAFLDIPTISLVTDLENLFDPESGNYVNAPRRGREWEREVSVELLNPDRSPGFQIDAGLRMRGGWGRRNTNPKHSFRIFFRQEYGYGKLKYPMFGDNGVDEFDNIDFRTSQNYSWASEGNERNTLVRELFSRDTQRDMGQPHTRSRYYHLYLNGVYWGLYQTQERAEASFASSYLGGVEEDYDVVKIDPGDNLDIYEIEATDGNLDAYQQLWVDASWGFDSDTAFYQVIGQNIDGTVNPNYEKLVDVENLADYMICTYYVGDWDGPVNINQLPNNFYGIYNRTNPDGFKYFRHDAEHSLHYRTTDVTLLCTGGAEFRHFNPRWLHQRLIVHPEYRFRFADRVYKHYSNNGSLTPASSIARVNSRANTIEKAIIALSCRWGDSISETPRTRDDDWIPAINFILENLLPFRTDVTLGQYKIQGWYPDFDPPEFDLSSGIVAPGTELTISSQVGSIYYTTDGSDPRLLASVDEIIRISSSAVEYDTPLDINTTAVVKSRVLYEGDWSPLNEVSLWVPQGFDNLIITEIHYHPLDNDTVDDTELEFIELKNVGDATLEIDGLSFTLGIEYTFDAGTQIEPDGYIVLASNMVEFESRYGFEPFGEYEGQLSNGGETVILENSTGEEIVSVTFEDRYPWPNSADGAGNSLVLNEENLMLDLNDVNNWHASLMQHGTPGIMGVETPEDNLYNELPSGFALYQNYPNPFNPTTTILFDIPAKANVEVVIYNILGQKVRLFQKSTMSAGKHTIQWDGKNDKGMNLTSGIYICVVRCGDRMRAKRMIMLK